MPIMVPDNLPAKDILAQEEIFLMEESRAFSQDIRALKIAILNLMPNKQITEVQILRLLGNTPLQVELTLLHPKTHVSKNTSAEYLTAYYQTFDSIRDQRFDGLIVTGAPIELLEFEEVKYWDELTEIFDWAKKNVMSTFYICWAAQAALYYYYNVPKYTLRKKMFGIFPHCSLLNNVKLLRGFDDRYHAPHSRHTEVRIEDIRKVKEVDVLSYSDEAGVYIAASKDGRQIFVTGHSEYEPMTLKGEYFRDLDKGVPIDLPRHYFENDDPLKDPIVKWRSHAHLLYGNWLNYYVYQETPFDLSRL